LPDSLPEDAPLPLHHLFDTHREVSRKNLLESYHDALGYRDECLSLFLLNHLSLEQRVLAEDLFWSIVTRVLRLTRELPELPEELEGLERALADTYFCNFSIFQSLPDAWAIDQLFPIVPIHRLDEEPTRRGVIADITCDSDGKIEHFIDRRDVKSVLELHPLTDEPYYLGIFLGGAYQEILGDLHNLFGDTNAVHITFNKKTNYKIDTVITGDATLESLKYVQYEGSEIVKNIRDNLEKSVALRKISIEESSHFLELLDRTLQGYTYLGK